jgi:hypothetical protein
MLYHDDHYEDGTDLPHGICDECGQSCTGKMMDFGIGAYEFWGARGTHTDYQAVSPCCAADIVSGNVRLVRSVVHVAKKQHKGVKTILSQDGIINPGDKYQLMVYRHHRKNGPKWITTTKRLIERGPKWITTTKQLIERSN